MYGGLHFINGPNGEKNYYDMKDAPGPSNTRLLNANTKKVTEHASGKHPCIIHAPLLWNVMENQQSDYTKWQQQENSSTNANGKAGVDERMSISNTGKQYKWRHLEKKKRTY